LELEKQIWLADAVIPIVHGPTPNLMKWKI
jgi:hypothetical protein